MAEGKGDHTIFHGKAETDYQGEEAGAGVGGAPEKGRKDWRWLSERP